MAVADEFSRPSATAPAYDRQPPQDVAAEQSVLGGMLLSKDAIADVVEALHGADFYRPAHKVIFDCVLDLYGRGEPADAITVAAELNRTDQLSKMGGAVYLHTLIASTPTAANAGYYAAIVAEQAVLRRRGRRELSVAPGSKVLERTFEHERRASWCFPHRAPAVWPGLRPRAPTNRGRYPRWRWPTTSAGRRRRRRRTTGSPRRTSRPSSPCSAACC